MCNHLIQNNFKSVNIYTRTKTKATPLIELGATFCETPKEIGKKSDIVISIVGYPKDVENIYLGENGVLTSLEQGGVIIDMTTSTPTLSKKIYEEALKKNIYSLDAPVSGFLPI
jgi:3-hydroxyisobutyrate dehydrogenase